MIHSAGTLLYRRCGDCVEVLLIHPAGAYNRRAPWGIPKGVPNRGEDLEQTARRETFEETGVSAGPLTPVGFIEYHTGRKRVHCFTGPAPTDATPNADCSEVDAAQFLPLSEARQRIHRDQVPFLDRLERLLAEQA